jgi:hypothetical protein
VPSFQGDAHERPVVAVRLGGTERLEVDRHDPDALFAGALREQLLRPCPERRDLLVGQEGQLVATIACERPDGQAEREPGLAGGSGSRHAASMAVADSIRGSRSIPMSEAGTRPTYVSAL